MTFTDAEQAARHWYSVAQQQAEEIAALKERTDEAYRRGQEDGKNLAYNSVAEATRTVGAMTEQEEASVRLLPYF